MHFVNPGFLWALLLLSVPIIIHLFKFRRHTPVLFPNIRFLKKLTQEQRSRRRLKDLLILFSRLIALAGIILAFARPFLGDKGQKAGDNYVSVYVDNSFSMENEAEQGILLDVARKKAEEIAYSFQPTDRFHLITNSLESQNFRWVDRASFLESLYGVEVSPRSIKYADIEAILTTLEEIPQRSEEWRFIISDFQKSSFEELTTTQNQTAEYRIIPIKPVTPQNLSVDSIWFERPIRIAGKSDQVYFRVTNHMEEPIADVPVQLRLNGQPKGMVSISIPSATAIDTSIGYKIPINKRIHLLELELEDQPITFDNHYFFTFEVNDKIKITQLRPAQIAKTSFDILYEDTLYDYTSMDERRIDYEKLESSNLIILNGLTSLSSGLISFMNRWIAEGGNAVVIPSNDSISTQALNNWMQKIGLRYSDNPIASAIQVTTILQEDPLFQNVFKEKPRQSALPKVSKYFSIGITDPLIESLFGLPGNKPFLARKQLGDGLLYAMAIPDDSRWSNWNRHALFVTTFSRIAELSASTPVYHYEIGKDEIIDINAKIPPNELAELIVQQGNYILIPEQQVIGSSLRLQMNNSLSNAGYYDLRINDSVYTTLAFNYSRDESIMDFFSQDEIRTWIEEMQNADLIDKTEGKIKTNTIRSEKPLWKFFLVLALVFLIFEIIIIKTMN